MDSILLYYSFLNLIFLFNESVGSRETYSSSFACDIGCCPRRFVSSRRILDCLPYFYSRFNTFILLILILFFLVYRAIILLILFSMIILAPLRNYF
nr:MAG TPA: hypothetical protein [Caudoviricetes sp.]